MELEQVGELNTDLVRAALPTAVLALLAAQASHGYALMESLQGLGFSRVRGGTLYPLLHRLEEQQLISSTWQHDATGPGRKVLTITDAGRAELAQGAQAWRAVATLITNLEAIPRRTSS